MFVLSKRRSQDTFDPAVTWLTAFAAWLGLTPLQIDRWQAKPRCRFRNAANGRSRRLLIIGASAVVQQARPRGAPKGSWLAQMLDHKPKMLVTIALANKMARIVWALAGQRWHLQNSGRGGVG